MGWNIVGETCFGSSHLPKEFNVTKTNILDSGRGILLNPCQNQFRLCVKQDVLQSESNSIYEPHMDNLWKTEDAVKSALSTNDRAFLENMSSQLKRDKNGFWTSSLPFKPNHCQKLQNNYDLALK